MKWISIKDQLPDMEQEILCLYIDEDPRFDSDYFVGRYSQDCESKEIGFVKWDSYGDGYFLHQTNYWMKLPELPKKE